MGCSPAPLPQGSTGAISTAQVLYIFAIITTELIGNSSRFQDNAIVMSMFGSVTSSMWSLFAMMTLDSWSQGIAGPVIEVDFRYSILFLSFIMIAVFGLMNLVTGIVVEHAMRSASEDDESRAQIRRQERQRRMNRLTENRAVFMTLGGMSQQMLNGSFSAVFKTTF